MTFKLQLCTVGVVADLNPKILLKPDPKPTHQPKIELSKPNPK